MWDAREKKLELQEQGGDIFNTITSPKLWSSTLTSPFCASPRPSRTTPGAGPSRTLLSTRCCTGHASTPRGCCSYTDLLRTPEVIIFDLFSAHAAGGSRRPRSTTRGRNPSSVSAAPKQASSIRGNKNCACTRKQCRLWLVEQNWFIFHLTGFEAKIVKTWWCALRVAQGSECNVCLPIYLAVLHIAYTIFKDVKRLSVKLAFFLGPGT